MKETLYKGFFIGLGLQRFTLRFGFLQFSPKFARVSPCFIMDLLKTNKQISLILPKITLRKWFEKGKT
jgi:hypothetical protein